MNGEELGRLLTSVVPELPAPPDRVAAVRRRSRRQRRNAAIASAGLAVLVGLGGTWWALAPKGSPGRVTGDPSVRTSAPRTDGVLETPGCATYSNAPTTAIQGTPVIGNSDIINDLNNRLVPYATAHFGDVYALTEVETDIGRLRVYRKPSAAFDAWMMREFARDCVEIADAKASAQEMEAWSRRIIDDDRAYWSNRGISIQTVSGNPVTGVVEVGVSAKGLARARSELPAHYPGAQIVVVESQGVSY
jgi:hypothetical protein